MTFGPVFFVLGLLISVLAFAMLIPAAVDLLWGHADWPVFVAASALTLFVGVTLMLSFRGSTAK
ncbi:MAG: potassium transporter TrkH, partial [Pseudomonadota bacterium]|nr:potassium transporter TrkH [Pseudomonadota bacterium]